MCKQWQPEMKCLRVGTSRRGGGYVRIPGQLYVYIIASTAGEQEATRSDVVDRNEICQPF